MKLVEGVKRNRKKKEKERKDWSFTWQFNSRLSHASYPARSCLLLFSTMYIQFLNCHRRRPERSPYRTASAKLPKSPCLSAHSNVRAAIKFCFDERAPPRESLRLRVITATFPRHSTVFPGGQKWRELAGVHAQHRVDGRKSSKQPFDAPLDDFSLEQIAQGWRVEPRRDCLAKDPANLKLVLEERPTYSTTHPELSQLPVCWSFEWLRPKTERSTEQKKRGWEEKGNENV